MTKSPCTRIIVWQQGFSEDQIALLMEISRPLVKEYLAVYRQNDSPECRERLAAQVLMLYDSEKAGP